MIAFLLILRDHYVAHLGPDLEARWPSHLMVEWYGRNGTAYFVSL